MLLLIDTSQETGTVALAEEGKLLWEEENKITKEHAGWLHEAVRRLLNLEKITIQHIEAVSVMAGPGSYTGLRVGMAAAKGFCYALKIPLITQNSLVVMAESMRGRAMQKNAMICPMIDARRDEVYTAVFQEAPAPGHLESVIENRGLQIVLPPQAMILDKNAFELLLTQNPIIFFGSGAAKWKKITSSPFALFEPQQNINQAFAILSQRDLANGKQADPIYAEPVYLKEFFTY
jgi:tRNA threonylcarbamoyladenosine biosynthesis protein TsaB